MAQLFECTDKRCIIVLSSAADEDGTIHFAAASMTPDLVTLSTMSNVVEPTTLELTPEAMNVLAEWWLIFLAEHRRAEKIDSEIKEALRLLVDSASCTLLQEKGSGMCSFYDGGKLVYHSIEPEQVLETVKQYLYNRGEYMPTDEERGAFENPPF